MPNTVLNVVHHRNGGYRFGVICREFLMVPHPRQIIVNGLFDQPLLVPSNNLYTIHGSLYHEQISNWITDHYPRAADEDLWLMKFRFEVEGDRHVYSYEGVSPYRKVSHRKELRDPAGAITPYHTQDELIHFVWED